MTNLEFLENELKHTYDTIESLNTDLKYYESSIHHNNEYALQRYHLAFDECKKLGFSDNESEDSARSVYDSIVDRCDDYDHVQLIEDRLAYEHHLLVVLKLAYSHKDELE